MIWAARSGLACACTISSKVRRISSIIACRSPPATSISSVGLTLRGLLVSSRRPIDWASRRAGSIVSTTTERPRAAARNASAAAVVVLPTPPAPQHTITRVARSPSISSTSKGRKSRVLITLPTRPMRRSGTYGCLCTFCARPRRSYGCLCTLNRGGDQAGDGQPGLAGSPNPLLAQHLGKLVNTAEIDSVAPYFGEIRQLDQRHPGVG